jgi:hypothetical protein
VSDPDTVAARRVAAEAENAFRFLHDELGFDEPSAHYRSFAVWVTWKSAATGVKATFDTLDRVVETFVVKLVEGHLPPYDETEGTHYIDVASLASVAGRVLPVDDLKLRSLSGDEFRRVLDLSAGVVNEFGDILRGDFRRFDEAIAERRAYIARLETDYQRGLADEETRSLRRRFTRWFGRVGR